jgi:hypothetical protein
VLIAGLFLCPKVNNNGSVRIHADSNTTRKIQISLSHVQNVKSRLNDTETGFVMISHIAVENAPTVLLGRAK